jgi:hypothetical protein
VFLDSMAQMVAILRLGIETSTALKHRHKRRTAFVGGITLWSDRISLLKMDRFQFEIEQTYVCKPGKAPRDYISPCGVGKEYMKRVDGCASAFYEASPQKWD